MAGRARLIGAMLLAAALAPAPLGAQSAPRPPRIAVLATVGAMHPLDAGVRGLYEGPFVPVTVEADIRVAWKLFVFGGGQFIGKDGEVVFDQPPAPVERFALRVSTASLRVGGGIAHPWQRWMFSAAAGLSYTHYREQWMTEEIPAVTGYALGFIVTGGADYRIFKRLWAVGRVEYAHTPMDETRQSSPTFDLSGVSVSGGVAVRF